MTISHILAPLCGSPDDAIVLATAVRGPPNRSGRMSARCFACPDAREIAYAPDLREAADHPREGTRFSQGAPPARLSQPRADCAGAVTSEDREKVGYPDRGPIGR